MPRLEVGALPKYAELLGERTINGRRLVVEELIEELAGEFTPLLNAALRRRREWLDSGRSLGEKGRPPGWGDRFVDADGDARSFREIVQGLIDNFLDRDTPLRWRLNENVPVPPDAHPTKNAGLEITGPWYPLSRAIHQINADVAVAFEDEEDASPAWYVPHGSSDEFPPVWEARRNVRDVLSGNMPTPYYEKGKEYRIMKSRGKWPTVFHRVPGIHLLDSGVLLDGRPVPAIITSTVIYVINNYESLRRANSGVYLYVPKVQTPDEALIIEKILRRLEEKMGLRRGEIKIAMLYEEGMAGLYLPVILWVWRERLIKSSNGRWDYLGSLIEMWKDEATFPDPQTITMTSPNMMAYQRYNALIMTMAGVKDGHVHAAPVGGMAAVMLYPQTDPYGRHRYNYKALRDIKLDKLRERLIGLIFVPESGEKAGKVRLDDVLGGRVRGRLYDMFRQSWVATKEEQYVAAGNEPLRAELRDLQGIIDAEVRYTSVGGKTMPTVESGLTPEERARFRDLGLLDEEGRITPWVVPRSEVDSPEKLFGSRLWGGKTLWEALYGVPAGEITVEHIQHAFYMAANYGFQILNGNLAAAIDDYELNQRFMNDLATYRIFVAWLWTIIRHRAKVTRDGYLKAPALTENGVVPARNVVEVRAGTEFTEELFRKLWELHQEWTRAFYHEYDRLAAQRIIRQVTGGEGDEELLKAVSDVLSRAYAAGPFRELSASEAAEEIAKVLRADGGIVEELVRSNAPRFDRSKASVIMDVLYRQLTSPRYLQHSARLLFAIAEADDEERERILEAVFSSSREEVVAKIKEGKLPAYVLEVHDYVYDYR